MVFLGLILLIVGLFTLPLLVWIGVALVLIGLFFNFVPVGGTTRRWY